MLLITIKFLLVIGMILGGIILCNIYFSTQKNKLSVKQISQNITFLKSKAPQPLQNRIKYWARVSSVLYIIMAFLIPIDAYMFISNLWAVPTLSVWILSIIVFMLAYLFIYSQTKLYSILIRIDALLDKNYLHRKNIFILNAKRPLIITLTLSIIFCSLNI